MKEGDGFEQKRKKGRERGKRVEEQSMSVGISNPNMNSKQPI